MALAATGNATLSCASSTDSGSDTVTNGPDQESDAGRDAGAPDAAGVTDPNDAQSQTDAPAPHARSEAGVADAPDVRETALPRTDCQPEDMGSAGYLVCHVCHAPDFLPPEAGIESGMRLPECESSAATTAALPEDLPCGACDEEGAWCEMAAFAQCDCDGPGGHPPFAMSNFEDAVWNGWVCTCARGAWSCWIRDESGGSCWVCETPPNE